MSFEEILRKNEMKTYFVLGFYIFIFAVIGLLVDIVRIDSISLEYGFYALITLQVFPLATFIMALVAIGVILYSLNRFDAIMLKGDEYELIDDSHHLGELQRRTQRAFENVLRKARFQVAPRLYFIYADYMNAFASGWKEENSLVAVTSALVKNLNDKELESVLAHELSHIRHGDIRLTMIVGILSNILLLVCNNIVWLFMGHNRSAGAQKARMILLVLQFVLPLLTMWMQMFLSRSREYMADGGSAYIMGDPNPLISALQKISNSYQNNNVQNNNFQDSNPTRKAAYIFDFSDTFSTHPSLQNRIKSLLARK